MNVEKTFEDLFEKMQLKHKAAIIDINKQTIKEYKLLVKDKYLESFYYKGVKVTVTAVDLLFDDVTIESNKVKISWDWMLTLSTSFTNSIQITLRDYIKIKPSCITTDIDKELIKTLDRLIKKEITG